MKKLLAVGCLLFLTSTAWAQPYRSGTVYGVYPEGVLVQRNGGSYLIPGQQATFRIGDVSVSWSDLQRGQYIDYRIPQERAVYVPDPYNWEQRYHPRHPHGAPPGQKKKWRNKGRGW